MHAFAKRYGASPIHLAAHLAALALAAWAVMTMLDQREARNWVIWVLLAALAHDLLLWPVYTLVDRAARLGRATPAINVVRIPALVSGVLLLVSFPLICDKAPANYERVSGVTPDGYLQAWLLITAGLFLVSFLLAGLRAARRGGAAGRAPAAPPRRPGW